MRRGIGWRCIEERELDGETWEARRQYVFGGQYLDEVLIFDRDTNNDGDCTENEGNGSVRYLYCTNDNYNVMAVTDATGVTFERVRYDPYGTPTVTQEQGQSATGNPWLFQGQRYCPETGLCYFKNRDHSPTLGRFIQRDSAGYVDGMSLYEFARNAPILSSDPSGYAVQASRCCCCIMGDLSLDKIVARYSAEASGEPGVFIHRMGHEFDLLVPYAYVDVGQELIYNDCTLQWRERHNHPEDVIDDRSLLPEFPGWRPPARQYSDVMEWPIRPGLNTILETWENRPRACPMEKRTVSIHDAPYRTWWVLGLRMTRTIDFEWIAKSSPEPICIEACKAAGGRTEASLKAQQLLRIDNGKPDWNNSGFPEPGQNNTPVK